MKQEKFDMTVSPRFLQKQWAKKVGSFRRKEDIVAWLEFQRAVQELRETALEVGVVIKSPDAVRATSGRQINQSQLQIYGKTRERSANNRALPRQKPDVDGMLRNETGG